MEFSKCIALNSLVKTRGARNSVRFGSISVEFDMFVIGHWGAVVCFPQMMFDRELQDFIGWALANTRSHFLSSRDDKIYLFLQ